MMTKTRLLPVFLMALGCVPLMSSSAPAQATVGGVVSQVGFDQKLGTQLPLDLRFHDDQGREIRLAELFGRRL